MQTSFNAAERENKTVNELAGLIGYILKEEARTISNIPLEMLKHLYGEDTPNSRDAFFRKFYEAIALLEQWGLVVYYMERRGFFGRSDFYAHCLLLTSVGRETDFRDEILILDDAQEIVNSLKKEIPNLDGVVSQYYQDSIRACQVGAYNSSSLSLGGASERAIELLTKKVSKKCPRHAKHLRSMKIANKTKYLEKNFKNIFGFITDDSLKFDLKDRLSGLAHMYRRNRNEAGHPRDTPLDITRDEQVCYLNSFRRYARTIFKAIELLDPNP
ncbi:hypothetical protein ACFL6S_16520 [Candidatus Poribacteria bacterium]